MFSSVVYTRRERVQRGESSLKRTCLGVYKICTCKSTSLGVSRALSQVRSVAPWCTPGTALHLHTLDTGYSILELYDMYPVRVLPGYPAGIIRICHYPFGYG